MINDNIIGVILILSVFGGILYWFCKLIETPIINQNNNEIYKKKYKKLKKCYSKLKKETRYNDAHKQF